MAENKEMSINISGSDSEKQINLNEQIQKISSTVAEYKDKLVTTFKGMDVAVKDWNFSVGKTDDQYNIEVVVKLNIKPKQAV
jgi:polyphosphate kinase 2 (PPK2 family)